MRSELGLGTNAQHGTPSGLGPGHRAQRQSRGAYPEAYPDAAPALYEGDHPAFGTFGGLQRAPGDPRRRSVQQLGTGVSAPGDPRHTVQQQQQQRGARLSVSGDPRHSVPQQQQQQQPTALQHLPGVPGDPRHSVQQQQQQPTGLQHPASGCAGYAHNADSTYVPGATSMSPASMYDTRTSRSPASLYDARTSMSTASLYDARAGLSPYDARVSPFSMYDAGSAGHVYSGPARQSGPPLPECAFE